MAAEFKSEYSEVTLNENFQPSDVLCDNRPLREYLFSSLKVLGKFSLGAIVLGGSVWLGGNAIIDALPQPVPITFTSILSKEMVSGFAGFAALAGGLTTVFSSTSSHN